MICTPEQVPDQLSFVPQPRVAIELHPHPFLFYCAWLPNTTVEQGWGNTKRQAIRALAGSLVSAYWDDVDPESLELDGQLLAAVTRLSQRDLIDYLCSIADPALLSEQYGLVLR